MMPRITSIKPLFTDSVPMPDEMEPGVVYISVKYDSASHKCACGCGFEVVTPLSRIGWTLHYDGSVSLTPSIGNHELPCRSHYVIRNNSIRWLPRFSRQETMAARNALYTDSEVAINGEAQPNARRGFFRRLFGFRDK